MSQESSYFVYFGEGNSLGSLLGALHFSETPVCPVDADLLVKPTLRVAPVPFGSKFLRGKNG